MRPAIKTDESKIWTTKKGERIPIKKMDDSHLINTINLLLRNTPRIATELLDEATDMLSSLSGEMAIYSMESEIFRITSASDEELLEYSIPQYCELIKECKKRKLMHLVKNPAPY